MHKAMLRSVVLLIVTVMLTMACRVQAQPSLIRDAEIEATLRAFSNPLFRAAGLDPAAVEIYIVNDNGINAFVAGGQRLFLNTGLILKATSPNQVIGVIAHEIGHIQGAHLARVQDAMRNATAESILALVLGLAAGLATGSPEIGSAAVIAGQDVANRNLLRYSRTQEGAADAAALRLLDATGQSAKGLLQFFHTLEDQELLAVGRQDPYLRTHPLSQDRIQAIEAHVARSRYSDVEDRSATVRAFERMKAKLFGFLSYPSVVYRVYPANDSSVAARYARSVAFHRENRTADAIAEIDSLLAEQPRDPFFNELKGQILFEQGRPLEALASYEAAVRSAPNEPQLRLALGRVQLALEDSRFLKPAITNFRAGLAREPDNAFAWRQLAIAYGRSGDAGRSSWALAEEASLRRHWDEATYHATRALDTLPSGGSERLKARDIQIEATRQLEK